MAKKRAIVIGGGITGLTTAYRLQRESAQRDMPLDIILLEATRTRRRCYPNRTPRRFPY